MIEEPTRETAGEPEPGHKSGRNTIKSSNTESESNRNTLKSGKSIVIKRLAIYLLFAFAPDWILVFLYAAHGGEYGTAAMELLMALAMLCPAVAVLLTRRLTGEGIVLTGPNSLKLGMDFKNKKWIWYLLAIFLPVIYGNLGALVVLLVYPGLYDPAMVETVGASSAIHILMPLAAIVNGVVVSFGALGEELGWRTYLYPKLEALMGTGKAVALGGVIWGIWHLPELLMGHGYGNDYWGEPWSGLVSFTLFCIYMGGLLWFVTKMTGSVWPAAFLHAINNAGSASLQVYINMNNIDHTSPHYILAMSLLHLPILLIMIVAVLYLRKRGKEELADHVKVHNTRKQTAVKKA